MREASRAARGSRAPFEHKYLVREVAAALAAVGAGASYTEAAQLVRVAAWGEGRRWNRGAATVVNGALVSEWLTEYGRVVCPPETAWPETLVLDSTEFMYTDTWSRERYRLFCLMFAYGYPADGSAPRLWRVASAPSDDTTAWAEFLAGLNGVPRVVVCDDDGGITAGVRAAWGRKSRVHRCEHHLYMRARVAFDKDKVAGDDPLHEQLNEAFRSPEQWRRFREAAAADKRWNVVRWAKRTDKRIAVQLERRGEVSVYANGAIEAPVRAYRAALERRAWCFRNRRRMDLLLEQMRYHANRADTVDSYTTVLRTWLRDHPGAPAGQRTDYDPRGVSSLRGA